MYARETAKKDHQEQELYDAVDERTIEWLRAAMAERDEQRGEGQLHPELIGRS